MFGWFKKNTKEVIVIKRYGFSLGTYNKSCKAFERGQVLICYPEYSSVAEILLNDGTVVGDFNNWIPTSGFSEEDLKKYANFDIGKAIKGEAQNGKIFKK